MNDLNDAIKKDFFDPFEPMEMENEAADITVDDYEQPASFSGKMKALFVSTTSSLRLTITRSRNRFTFKFKVDRKTLRDGLITKQSFRITKLVYFNNCLIYCFAKC